MCRPFYQASAADPQGVVRRRRFGFAGGELTGFEDEHLDRGGRAREPRSCARRSSARASARCATSSPPSSPTRTSWSGRRSTSRSACRARPGTGKTAVGLHRAAYLLYTHAGGCAAPACWWSGPNRAFLRYIAQVLPALGEVEVEQTTVDELIARVPVRAEDPPEVAVLKGDARMADVLRRALWGEIAKPAESIQVPLAGRRYRVPVERLKRYVDDLRRRAAPTTTSSCCTTRPAGSGWRCCWPRTPAGRRRRPAAAPRDAETRRAARSAEVRAFCDEVWPARDAAGLVCELLDRPGPARPRPPTASSTTRSRRCCAGRRRRGRSRTAPWIGGRRRARRRGGRAARAHRRATATWSSTRRRTSRPCSAARSPAAGRRLAHRARRPGPGHRPWSPSDWRETLATWAGRAPSCR